MKKVLEAIYSNQLLELTKLDIEDYDLTSVHNYNGFEGTLLMHAVRSNNINIIQWVLNLRDETNLPLVPINKIVNDNTALDLIINADQSIDSNAYITTLLIQNKAQTALELSQNTHDSVTNKTAKHAVDYLLSLYADKTASTTAWEIEVEKNKDQFKYIEYSSLINAFKRIRDFKTSFQHLGNLSLLQVMHLVWYAVNDLEKLTHEQKIDCDKSNSPDERIKTLSEIIECRRMALWQSIIALQNEYGTLVESCPHGLVNGLISSLNGIFPNIRVVDKTEIDQLVISEINNCIKIELDQINSLPLILKIFYSKIEEEPSGELSQFYANITDKFKAIMKTSFSKEVLPDIQECYNPWKPQFQQTLEQMSLPSEGFKFLEYISLLLFNAKISTDFLYETTASSMPIHIQNLQLDATSLLAVYCSEKNKHEVINFFQLNEISSCIENLIRKKSLFIKYNGDLNLCSFFIWACNSFADEQFFNYLEKIRDTLCFIQTKDQLLYCMQSIKNKLRSEQLFLVTKDLISLDLKSKLLVSQNLISQELIIQNLEEIINTDINSLRDLQIFYKEQQRIITEENISFLQQRFCENLSANEFLEFLDMLPITTRLVICRNSPKVLLNKYINSELLLSMLLTRINPDEWGDLLSIFQTKDVQECFAITFSVINALNVIKVDSWKDFFDILFENYGVVLTKSSINFLMLITLINPQFRVHFCKAISRQLIANAINTEHKLCVFLSYFSENQQADVISIFSREYLHDLLLQDDGILLVLEHLSPQGRLKLFDYLGHDSIKNFVSSLEILMSLNKLIDVFSLNILSYADLTPLVKNLADVYKLFRLFNREQKLQFYESQGGLDYFNSLGADSIDICNILFNILNTNNLGELPGRYSSLQFYHDEIANADKLVKFLVCFKVPERISILHSLGGTGLISRLCCNLSDFVNILSCFEAETKVNLYQEQGGDDYIFSLKIESRDLACMFSFFPREVENSLFSRLGGTNTIEQIFRIDQTPKRLENFIKLLSTLTPELSFQVIRDIDKGLLLNLTPSFLELIELPGQIFLPYIDYLMDSGGVVTYLDYEQLQLDNLHAQVISQTNQQMKNVWRENGKDKLSIDDLLKLEIGLNSAAAISDIIKLSVNPFSLIFSKLPDSLKLNYLISIGGIRVSEYMKDPLICFSILQLLPENQRVELFNLLTHDALLEFMHNERVLSEGFLKQFLLGINKCIPVISESCGLNSNIANEESLSRKEYNLFEDIAETLNSRTFFAILMIKNLPVSDFHRVINLLDTEEKLNFFNKEFFDFIYTSAPYKNLDFLQMHQTLLLDTGSDLLRNNIVDSIDFTVFNKLDNLQLRFQFLSSFSLEELLVIFTKCRVSLFVTQLAKFETFQEQLLDLDNNHEINIYLPEIIEWLYETLGLEFFSVVFSDPYDLNQILTNLTKDYHIRFLNLLGVNILGSISPHELMMLLNHLDHNSQKVFYSSELFAKLPLDIIALHALIKNMPCDHAIEFLQHVNYSGFMTMQEFILIYNSIVETYSIPQLKYFINNFPYRKYFGVNLDLNNLMHYLRILNIELRSDFLINLCEITDSPVDYDSSLLVQLFASIPVNEIARTITILKSKLSNIYPKIYNDLVVCLFMHGLNINDDDLVYILREFGVNFISAQKNSDINYSALIFKLLSIRKYNVVIDVLFGNNFDVGIAQLIRVLNFCNSVIREPNNVIDFVSLIPFERINYKGISLYTIALNIMILSDECKLQFLNKIFSHCPEILLPKMLTGNGNIFEGLVSVETILSERTFHLYNMILSQTLFPRLISVLPQINKLAPQSFCESSIVTSSRFGICYPDLFLRTARNLLVSSTKLPCFIKVETLDLLLTNLQTATQDPKLHLLCKELFSEKLFYMLLAAIKSKDCAQIDSLVGIIKLLRSGTNINIEQLLNFSTSGRSKAKSLMFRDSPNILTLYIKHLQANDIEFVQFNCEQLIGRLKKFLDNYSSLMDSSHIRSLIHCLETEESSYDVDRHLGF